MIKQLIFVTTLLASLFLLVACVSESSEEELKTGLAAFSDEELDAVLEEAETEKSAVAGQAILRKRGYTFTNKQVSRDKLLIAAQSLKIERLQQQLTQLKRTPGQEEGIIVIGGSEGAPGEKEGIIVIDHAPGESTISK